MSRDNTRSVLSVGEVEGLVNESFPQIHAGGRSIFIESVGDRQSRLRMRFTDESIRPGGTIAGPSMFKLADFGIYVALIATLGADGIRAVTSNLNITFLTRPEQRDLIAETRIIRLGRRLAYAEVALRSEGHEDMVAHATGTYAIPRAPSAV